MELQQILEKTIKEKINYLYNERRCTLKDISELLNVSISTVQNTILINFIKEKISIKKMTEELKLSENVIDSKIWYLRTKQKITKEEYKPYSYRYKQEDHVKKRNICVELIRKNKSIEEIAKELKIKKCAVYAKIKSLIKEEQLTQEEYQKYKIQNGKLAWIKRSKNIEQEEIKQEKIEQEEPLNDQQFFTQLLENALQEELPKEVKTIPLKTEEKELSLSHKEMLIEILYDERLSVSHREMLIEIFNKKEKEVCKS